MSTKKRPHNAKDMQAQEGIIERLRKELHLESKARLADYFQASSRQAISKYCRGLTRIPLLDLLRIAEDHDLDITYILTGNRVVRGGPPENNEAPPGQDAEFLRQVIDDQRTMISVLSDRIEEYKTACESCKSKIPRPMKKARGGRT